MILENAERISKAESRDGSRVETTGFETSSRGNEGVRRDEWSEFSEDYSRNGSPTRQPQGRARWAIGPALVTTNTGPPQRGHGESTESSSELEVE
ncbi:hypothetical protein [Halostagnicola bangensis]